MAKLSVRDLDVRGKRVFMRVDYNVPMEEKDGQMVITDATRIVETLPTLQHDPNRPEDVLKVDADEDGIGGDDAADALRYLVATKARTITQRKLRGF